MKMKVRYFLNFLEVFYLKLNKVGDLLFLRIAQEWALARYKAAVCNKPERLVSGSDDFTMFFWEPSTSKKSIARLTGHQKLVNHVSFSPDGHLFASASFDNTVKLWDGFTGK